MRPAPNLTARRRAQAEAENLAHAEAVAGARAGAGRRLAGFLEARRGMSPTEANRAAQAAMWRRLERAARARPAEAEALAAAMDRCADRYGPGSLHPGHLRQWARKVRELGERVADAEARADEAEAEVERLDLEAGT